MCISPLQDRDRQRDAVNSKKKKKKNVLLEEQKKIKCKKTVSVSGRRRVLRKVGELLPLHPGAQYE